MSELVPDGRLKLVTGQTEAGARGDHPGAHRGRGRDPGGKRRLGHGTPAAGGPGAGTHSPRPGQDLPFSVDDPGHGACKRLGDLHQEGDDKPLVYHVHPVVSLPSQTPGRDAIILVCDISARWPPQEDYLSLCQDREDCVWIFLVLTGQSWEDEADPWEY